MPLTLSLHRLAPLLACGFAIFPAACSIERHTDRCAAESTSLEKLIACKRQENPALASCTKPERGPAATPVAGRRVLNFGEKTKHGGTSKGIVFEAARGAGVRAPIEGTVTFADAWRSYGQVLIIDGCSTVAVMAGSLSPNVIPGQNIKSGAPIAQLSNVPDDAPVLYLEMRENGSLIDPSQFIPTD